MQANEIKVFYSYSHKDEKLRDRLETHLALLKRDGVISTWHDRRIGAGSAWNEEIHEQLNSSQIILLLISADFLASDYCFNIELKRAMELHEGGDARVIPIILRPCEWARAPFGRVHVLPRDARPVIHWRDHDSAFTDIAHGIREAVSLLRIRSLEKEVAKGLEKKVKPPTPSQRSLSPMTSGSFRTRLPSSAIKQALTPRQSTAAKTLLPSLSSTLLTCS